MIVFVAAMLIYGVVVQQDFTRRTIPNVLPLLVVTLAIVRWVIAGAWPEFFQAFVMSIAALLLLFLMFTRGWIGGGDVKLIAASLLLVGLGQSVPFLIYMSAIGGLMVPVAIIQTWFGPRKGEPLTVPYGIAISVAALWVLYPSDAPSIIGAIL